MLVVVGVLLLLYMFWYCCSSQAQLEYTGLPLTPKVFVNREQEQFDIINSLTTSGPNHSHIVTVTGAPGHGKSALATVCGYILHNMGIRVRHVDLQGVYTEEDFIDGILDALSSGTNQKPPTRINLMQSVKKVVDTVILILDNADCFTLSESQRENFISLINGVVHNSNGFVKVIITTQYGLSFKDHGLHVAIRNLTLQHSLQLFIRRNPLQIESLTVDEFLEKLMSDPLVSLSEDNTEYGMKRIFSFAMKHLSENDRMCFVLASLFPSSFAEHTATSVLTHFVNDTGCLHRLQSRSLIEYSYCNGVKRYHVLSLLKQHGNDIRTDDIDVIKFQVHLTLHHMSHPLQSQTHQQWVLQEHLNTETHTVRYLMENFNVTKNSIATEGEMSIVVHFAVESFNLLPFHHPLHVVEAFWANIQDMCRETIQHSVSMGACQTNFPDCLKFHLKVAQVSFHSKWTHLLKGVDFEDLGDLQVGSLIEAGCVDVSTAVKLLAYTAKYVETQGNTTTYQELLNTIQTLQNRTITQSDFEQVMEYDIGTILYELAEYDLAIEFLNACSNTSKRSQATKLIVESYKETGRWAEAENVTTRTKDLLFQQTKDLNVLFGVIGESNYSLREMYNENNMHQVNRTVPLIVMFSTVFKLHGESMMDLVDMMLSLNNSVFAEEVNKDIQTFTLNTKQFVDNITEAGVNLMSLVEEQCTGEGDSDATENCMTAVKLYGDVQKVRFPLMTLLARLLHTHIKCMLELESQTSEKVQNLLYERHNWFIPYNDILNATREGLKVEQEFMEKVLDEVKQSQSQALKEDLLLQFNMGQFLALFYTRVGKLKQAKLIADNALHFLPNVEVERKTHRYLQLQFLLARIQYSLGNYSVALEILRNCSLTIAVSDLKLPVLADPAGKELMKAYHDLIPSELQVVFDVMTVVKRTVLARVSVVKYSRSEELALFIILYVTIYVAMVGTVVSIIDGHYFIYHLYTSRSPMYKMCYTTLTTDMPMERPFLSLIIWTNLPPLLKYVLVTVSTAMIGSVTYYVHWHLYYILYYCNFV